MIDPISASVELPGEATLSAAGGSLLYECDGCSGEALELIEVAGRGYLCQDCRAVDTCERCGGAGPLRQLVDAEGNDALVCAGGCPSEDTEETAPEDRPGAAPLTLYLARQGGERVGDGLEASALQALQAAQKAIIDAYDDPEEEGWEEARDRDLAALEISSVTLSPGDWRTLGALLDYPEREARREFARLSRLALPAPTTAEVAQLCRAAIGVGRIEEVADALLSGDWTRLRTLQLGILGGGR